MKVRVACNVYAGKRALVISRSGHCRFCYISMPGHWKIFRDAYRRGRNAAPIAGWNWFAIVTEHTEELKKVTERMVNVNISFFNVQCYRMKKHLRSFQYAANGLRICFLSEINFRIHLLAAITAAGAGWYFRINRAEWIAVIGSIAAV